jgi:murein DD-endopeptidase MepM/ murein hydrolase activator NlpD
VFHVSIIALIAAAAAYAALVPQTTPQRASALINPAEGLSYSSALAEHTSTGLVLKKVTISEEGVSVTSEVGPAATEDDENPFFAAGLAARNDSAGLLAGGAGQTAETLASSLASNEAFNALDPGGTADELSPLQLTRYGCDDISEKYCVYEVQDGDNLSSIAERFGLLHMEDFEAYELIVYSNQQVVVDPDAVIPGQQLIIPRGQGVLHTVLSAETLVDIADRYGVDIEVIMAENGLGDADVIGIGTELLIPNPTRLTPPSTGDGGLVPAPEIVGGGDSSGFGFIWPASGPISSYFTAGHPLGIDIDLYNGANPPIGAAKGGTVSFAGGNPCCSYGYYVVIDHGDGFQTLYAHLSSIAVGEGQYVESGQLIGYGGTTGYSTGDHLHFEVHYGGSIVDPLGYLP